MREYGIAFECTASFEGFFFDTGPPGQSTSNSRYRFGFMRTISVVLEKRNDMMPAVIRTLVELRRKIVWNFLIFVVSGAARVTCRTMCFTWPLKAISLFSFSADPLNESYLFHCEVCVCCWCGRLPLLWLFCSGCRGIGGSNTSQFFHCFFTVRVF